MNRAKPHRHPLEKSVRAQAHAAGITQVLATLSGGADSTALTVALSRIPDITVTALHCNFNLRGEESLRDQKHAEQLCDKLGIDLEIKAFDVPGYMLAHKGTSLEMACRDLRHAWFAQRLQTSGYDRIATGHNADDNAETLMLNLLRGSGTSGLKGMLPDNGRIWRPLLAMHRSEIVQYLESLGVTYVADSSNLTSDYRRNFIRNEVMPLLRSRWPGADKAIQRSLGLLRAENAVVTQALDNVLPPAGKPLPVSAILEFADSETLIRRFIEPCGPFTTTASEILASIRAQKSDVRRWTLRNGSVQLRGGKLSVKCEV